MTTQPLKSQLEFFDSAQIGEPALADYPDAMVFPFLSLQKDRTKPIEFSDRERGVSISVSAHTGFYIASIWDWDFVIALSSILKEGFERNLPAPATIRFVPHNVLQIMQRRSSGREYINLANTIRRLQATRVETNIRLEDLDGGQGAFNWISAYNLPVKYQKFGSITQDDPDGVPDPTKPWEITLPPWLYKAVERGNSLLSVHPEYFKLTGGIERWLYRLAHEHMNGPKKRPVLNIPLSSLHSQSGLSSPIRKLDEKIRDIEDRSPLPAYGVTLLSRNENTRRNKNTIVTFYRKADYPLGRPQIA